MTVWIRWLVMFVLWMGMSLPGFSQDLNADTPRPPAFGVMDESGFFGRDSGALKRITDNIRKLDEAYGYKIYMVVEPVLIAATAPEKAIELQRAWVPDGNGMVVVFEVDTKSLGIGRDMGATPGQREEHVRVPSHETNAILNRAMEAVDSKLAPEVYLDHLVASLATGFDDYFKSLETPPPPGRMLKMGMLALGAAALLGLGILLAGTLVRHSGISGVARFRFPGVETPERLGAPCGASVTTRRFNPPGV